MLIIRQQAITQKKKSGKTSYKAIEHELKFK